MERSGALIENESYRIQEMAFFIEKHVVDTGRMAQIRVEVASGLRIRDGLGLDQIAHTTELAMQDAIAWSIYYSSAYLKHPLPDVVNFLKGKLANPTKNNPNYVLACSYKTAENPNGIISFSPYYLANVAASIEGRGIPQRLSLANLSGHEVYHLAQRDRFPVCNIKHTAKLSLDNRDWENTWSERGANIFGDYFDQARDDVLLRKLRGIPNI